MNLQCNGNEYQFKEVALRFAEGVLQNVFARKNNKTLGETIMKPRYLALAEESDRNYVNELGTPIGMFLSQLKTGGDNFYKRFLNQYGDLVYSRFWIEDKTILEERGVYLYAVGGRIMYIGRCKDSFGKRVNQGYGVIHPKNCYLDGQATNCHINALITGARVLGSVQFEVCPIPDLPTIVAVERMLIESYQPEWNIRLR
jgi:hypothetical protein